MQGVATQIHRHCQKLPICHCEILRKSVESWQNKTRQNISPPLLVAISRFPLPLQRGTKGVGSFRFLRLSHCETVAKSHNGGNPPHIHRENHIAIRSNLFLLAGKVATLLLLSIFVYQINTITNHSLVENLFPAHFLS